MLRDAWYHSPTESKFTQISIYVSAYAIAVMGKTFNPCFNGTYSRSTIGVVWTPERGTVLILVLMEHTLGGHIRCVLWPQAGCVLILVLMEHTLGVVDNVMSNFKTDCLNPCFNGTYSRRSVISKDAKLKIGLNPCFNGTYSRRAEELFNRWHNTWVLILVLMEHTLGDQQRWWGTAPFQAVLILVLMEHTLGDWPQMPYVTENRGLNPCFNGTYSRSAKASVNPVLTTSLNPCFNGTYSRSGEWAP